MLIRGGKHSSILIVLTSFIFCYVNTYSIAEEILAYHIYPKNEWLSFHFIFGLIYLFEKIIFMSVISF